MSLRAEVPDEFHSGPIMVVDDEPDVVETTALMLQERGLDTMTETNPRTALDRFDDRIACVVSDYRMPQMNGLEFFSELQDEYSAVPFILFTGQGSEAIASDAVEAGVDNYFQKGRREQYDRLANSVEKAVEKLHTERALIKRQQQFETVFENAFDGIFILDVDAGVIVDANSRACELLSYSYEELVGTEIREIHPEDYEEYLTIGRDLIDSDSRRRVESVCYTRNGEVVPSDITAAPMEYDGQTFLLTIMRPRRADQ